MGYGPAVKATRLVLLAALLLGACAESEAQPRGGPPPPLVVIGDVQPGPLTTTWSYVGEARALDDATLAAGASGEVLKVLVREGDLVAAGDLLVDIDDSLVRAQVRARRAASHETRTSLAQAERDRARAEQLGQVIAAAEVEREVARAEELAARSKSAKAQLAEAREALEEHEVHAPFDGVVAERLVDVGDWVDAGQAVLRVVADQQVEVLVDAAPELSAHVRVGGDVQILGKPLGTEEDGGIPGKVVGVVRALDPKTRTIKIRVQPTKTASWLMPGAPVHVAFPVTLGDGLVVHRDALVRGAVGTRVVRLVDQTAEPVEVQVVASTGEQVLVRAPDLELGDTVVVRGNERLRPGQAVRLE
jgi:RND family efflux transporter MFP subunit